MTTISPERLAEIEAACVGASGDEWWPVSSLIRVRDYPRPGGGSCSPVVCEVSREGTLANDAQSNLDFIAIARSALPELLATYKEQAEQLERAVEAVPHGRAQNGSLCASQYCRSCQQLMGGTHTPGCSGPCPQECDCDRPQRIAAILEDKE